ncbi:MAG: hypothetical protein KGJ66_15095 [Alphaproteobacteria bacterium]|nr:hypothetical protein [Alphaproteobacteria bacterium]
MVELLLPPLYRAVLIRPEQSAIVEARTVAATGAEEGTIFWSDRPDKLDAALLLHPDSSRRDTLPVIYVAALAFADALGAFAPPPAPVSFTWPCGVLIDGALIGGLSLAFARCGADDVPEWAVLGCELAVAADRGEPGRNPYRTSIVEEDFEGFSIAAQIEGFSRHFLAWLNRWETGDAAPIMAEWSRRAFGTMLHPTVDLPGGRRAMPLGLDATGNLRVRQDDGERVLPLEAALTDWAIHG